MGGLAFASGRDPLFTPRMPLAVYLIVRSRCHEILGQYFTHVATPIEGPSKIDYGDVDILVACPTPLGRGPSIVETLGKALGAERSIRGKGGPTVSFALSWPKETESLGGDSHTQRKGKLDNVFVQVDVHICNDKQDWAWELFHHAHGDLWNILGSTVRKLGLTVNNIGLYLRIEEIELIDRKKSMILLTKKPSEVLSFLGLDEARWGMRFDSAQEMYEYAAGCRFFWAKDAVKEIDEDKKELKHNDRQRMNSRPVFRQWIEEFIPQCRVNNTFSKQEPSREQIRDEAFERFGTKDQYDQRLDLWRRERQTDEVWRNVIKAGVPVEGVDPQFRAASIRGLKAIIIAGDLSDGIIPPKALKTEDGYYDMDEVINFVKSNWQRVGDIGFKKQRTRGAQQVDSKPL